MTFLIAMMLITLPLFLIVCIQIINQSSFGDTMAGRLLKGLFYVFIALSIFGALLLFSDL